MHDWPALRSWSIQHLMDNHGHVVVPMELSRDGGDYRCAYADSADAASRFQASIELPLQLLCEQMLLPLEQQRQLGDRSQPMPRLCIAQHDLLEHIPDMQAGIPPPPQVSACIPSCRLVLQAVCTVAAASLLQAVRERLHQRNTWLGPAGKLHLQM